MKILLIEDNHPSWKDGDGVTIKYFLASFSTQEGWLLFDAFGAVYATTLRVEDVTEYAAMRVQYLRAAFSLPPEPIEIYGCEFSVPSDWESKEAHLQCFLDSQDAFLCEVKGLIDDTDVKFIIKFTKTFFGADTTDGNT